MQNAEVSRQVWWYLSHLELYFPGAAEAGSLHRQFFESGQQFYMQI